MVWGWFKSYVYVVRQEQVISTNSIQMVKAYLLQEFVLEASVQNVFW